MKRNLMATTYSLPNVFFTIGITVGVTSITKFMLVVYAVYLKWLFVSRRNTRFYCTIHDNSRNSSAHQRLLMASEINFIVALCHSGHIMRIRSGQLPHASTYP